MLEGGETLNNHEIHILLRNLVTDRQELWLSSQLGIRTSFSLKAVEAALLKDGEESTEIEKYIEKYMRLCIFPFFS